MSKEKTERNKAIIDLINKGIVYRDIALVLNNTITLARVEEINNRYNKNQDKYRHCVNCGSKKNLILTGKIRNICESCARKVVSL